MIDPLSFAASLAGVTALTFNAGKFLYEQVNGIKNSTKTTREVAKEVESLLCVLSSLQETLKIADIDFSSLLIPLSSCARICDEFAALISECSAHSKDGKFSLRDFFVFSYKGKTISEFRSHISVYKSTVSIALADANLRQVIVTTNLLQEYKHKIDDTAAELDELLQRSEEPSCDPSSGELITASTSLIDMAEAAEERRSLEVCIDICVKMSNHIDEVEMDLVHQSRPMTLNRNDISTIRASKAEQITSGRLDEYRTGIGLTAAGFKLRLREMDRQTARMLRQPPFGDGRVCDATTASQRNEDLKGIQECLSICRSAEEQASNERINVFEDITVGDDSDQAIVSTFGDLTSARHVKVGVRATQMLGQMTDESLLYMIKANASKRNGWKTTM